MAIQISASLPLIATTAADALNRDIPLSKFVGQDVQLILSPEIQGITDAGKGTLYITTRNIVFYNSAECITIDYPSITVHAISRGDNDRLVRKPCIYCQLELPNGNYDDDVVPEMRLVPSDESCLDDLFLALNECAALNPDPSDDQAFEDGDENHISGSGLSAQGLRNLQHLENLLQDALVMDFGDYLDAQDWLIKLNPFTTLCKQVFQCPMLFDGLSRFLYRDRLLEFAPTRPAHRRKKMKLDKSVVRLESSQKVQLFKAIRDKKPSVLICWMVNGSHLYYLFDHTRMLSIDVKKSHTRPKLSIDLSSLCFEICKGPNIPRKTVLSELENCITDVNEWLQSAPMNDNIVNCVHGALVRDVCFERDACLDDVESDLLKYDENWKQFISKIQQSNEFAINDIAKAYNLISSQRIRGFKMKSSLYEHQQQLEWDREVHELINISPEKANDEQAWLTLLEKLKLIYSIKSFHRHLLK